MAADTPTPSSVLHERLLARLRLRHLKLIDALAAHSHLRRAAEAELPLRMNAPIAPLGILYRTDNAVGPLQLLVDFLVAQARKKP